MAADKRGQQDPIDDDRSGLRLIEEGNNIDIAVH
jgi:hypothetical protein